MQTVANSKNITDKTLELFKRPLPDMGDDTHMLTLLHLETEIKALIMSSSLHDYQKTHLCVPGDVDIDVCSKAVLSLSRSLDELFTTINEKHPVFSLKTNDTDPYIYFFRHHVVPTFITCVDHFEEEHYELVRNLHVSFEKFKRGQYFLRHRYRHLRKTANVENIRTYYRLVDRKRDIGKLHYFGIGIPPEYDTLDLLRTYKKWFSRWVSKEDPSQNKMWFIMLDYHFEYGLFLRVCYFGSRKDDIIDHFKVNGDLLFYTEQKPSEKMIADLLHYTYRKHHLLSPVTANHRIIYRSHG